MCERIGLYTFAKCRKTQISIDRDLKNIKVIQGKYCVNLRFTREAINQIACDNRIDMRGFFPAFVALIGLYGIDSIMDIPEGHPLAKRFKAEREENKRIENEATF